MKDNSIQKQKTLVIVAGVNGAGKSTAYETDPRFTQNIPIINPDVIAKEIANKRGAKSINDLPKKEQTLVNIQAAKIALQARENAFNKGIDFGIETTATSDATLRLIDKAHELNYKVYLVYIMLAHVKLHVYRVMQRVKNGGHNVPTEDILRRYERSDSILPKLLNKADCAVVYDNTDNYCLALLKENDKFTFFSCNEEVQRKLNPK